MKFPKRTPNKPVSSSDKNLKTDDNFKQQPQYREQFHQNNEENIEQRQNCAEDSNNETATTSKYPQNQESAKKRKKMTEAIMKMKFPKRIPNKPVSSSDNSWKTDDVSNHNTVGNYQQVDAGNTSVGGNFQQQPQYREEFHQNNEERIEQRQNCAEDSNNETATTSNRHRKNQGTSMNPPPTFPNLPSSVLWRRISTIEITVLHPYLCGLVFISLFVTSVSAYVIGGLIVLDVAVDDGILLIVQIVSMFATISSVIYIILEVCDGNKFINIQHQREEEHHQGCGCLQLVKKVFL